MVIVYGNGKCFNDFERSILSYEGKIDAIYDSSLVKNNIHTYKGIPVISVDDILRINMQTTVYICLYNLNSVQKVKKTLQINRNLTLVIPSEANRNNKRLNRDYILEYSNNNSFTDVFHNKILYKKDIPKNIDISFEGSNSSVFFENGIRIDKALHINLGTNAKIIIGSGTSFVNTNIMISFGTLEIGKDCLFSSGIYVRNHDGHHIFDLNTGKRVNEEKDIQIKEHVWVGHNAVILKGVTIGKGSVIGGDSIVTHSCGDNTVMAGNPAKVIKENVYWKRDLTNVFSFSRDME